MQAVIDRPPPPVATSEDSGGHGDRWVRVFRARGDIEAHLLSGRLNAAGIETTFLRDRGGAAWLHNGADPLAPVDILVKVRQLEDARFVLAEIAFEQPSERAPATQWTWRMALVWWTAAIALGLVFTGIALVRTSESIGCGSAWACPEAGPRP